MSETRYLKCPCRHCGDSIEFPCEGSDTTVSCPHCGEQTLLFNPDASLETEPGTTEDGVQEQPKRKVRTFGLVALAVVVTLIGLKVFHRKTDSGANGPASTEAHHVDQPKDVPVKREPASPAASVLSAKSIDDLKVGPITLERAKNSSLVYAVGTLRNASAHQRFGINVEIALADKNGNPAGIAKDYRDVIEPKGEWRFRALVLDPKAVSGKLLSVDEQH